MRKNSTGAGTIILYFAALLAVLAIIGFLAAFTDGFTSDLKTFYVECNGERILNDKTDFVADGDTEYRFDVKYVFGTAAKKQDLGYTASLSAYASDGNFDFTADGETYSFGAENDLADGFDLRQYDGYFTIAVPGGIEEVLKAVYPDSELVLPQTFARPPRFVLTVASEDGSAKINIVFYIHARVTGVGLTDKLEIAV